MTEAKNEVSTNQQLIVTVSVIDEGIMIAVEVVAIDLDDDPPGRP
jgi:hypothetical protein